METCYKTGEVNHNSLESTGEWYSNKNKKYPPVLLLFMSLQKPNSSQTHSNCQTQKSLERK